MKIILDTNFLIYCAKQKIDYVEEIGKLLSERYEIVIPIQVVDELEKLKLNEKKLKDREAAELALQLLEAKKIRKIEASGKTADESAIKLAREDKKNIVCTADRGIRKDLGKAIIPRGKRIAIIE